MWLSLRQGTGYRHVATIGFSMGASAVLRQAGLIGHVDAVVSVSGPGRWYYRARGRCGSCTWPSSTGSARIYQAIMKTRISKGKWDPVPLRPTTQRP